MNLLITICGRAGSKGVKNKNIRNFMGKPLIFYTLAAANLFRERKQDCRVDLCVSSDSDDLLQIAKEFDVVCIQRPEHFALDSSPKIDAIRHALTYMEAEFSGSYDYVIDLDTTSPLRKAADIENALQRVIENPDADVIFSVVPARRNPYFNMVEKKDGTMRKIINSCFSTRQQAPEVYDMNASIYCYDRNSLLNKLLRSPLDGVFDIVLMRDTGVLDIDSEEDFALMEILAREYFKEDFKEIFEYQWKNF